MLMGSRRALSSLRNQNCFYTPKWTEATHAAAPLCRRTQSHPTLSCPCGGGAANIPTHTLHDWLGFGTLEWCGLRTCATGALRKWQLCESIDFYQKTQRHCNSYEAKISNHCLSKISKLLVELFNQITIIIDSWLNSGINLIVLRIQRRFLKPF